MNTGKQITRWGIIGPGSIARSFAEGLRLIPDAVIEAVVSKSSVERARAFAEEYPVRKIYETYDEFFADPDIDIVYIAVINPMHKNVVLQALDAGKPVLCEKPFALNANEVRQMIEAARAKKLFLMEAMWVRFLPAAMKLRELLAENRIGTVKYLHVDLCLDLPDRTKRHYDLNAGGGALLDLGVYTISMASMILGSNPVDIKSSAFIGDTGVDEISSITLRYEDGAFAVLTQSFLMESPEEIWVVGTEGTIKIKSMFIGPNELKVVKETKTTELQAAEETYLLPTVGQGHRYQAEEAARCLREGKTESEIMPLDESLRIIEIMDEIRRQWGLVFPGE
ncbi:MAG: Gfo/Idh/MocA family oxidoreductase [Eubacterium sp.]|nr:Gfo/Idh/MocA family oxidoreductase [Eubacterium sp.]